MDLPFNIFGIGSRPKSHLGIDIGTLSIKIVEISDDNGRPKLENYAMLTNYDLMTQEAQIKKAFGGKAKIMLERLLKEAGMSAAEVNMSVPIFSSFLTVMDLPKMSDLELANAVQFEAKKYIPVSLDTVAIDWSVIGSSANGNTLVLLIAIPRELINEYTVIAKETSLKLLAIELETVAAARALIGNDPVPTMLVDMGSRDTTVSVVDGGHLQISHSIEMSGEDLTRALAKGLNIDWRRAEELKKQTGLKIGESGDQVASILFPLLNTVTDTIISLMGIYFSKANKKIEKLIIYGGASKMPGLVEYLNDRLKIDVVVGNSFGRIAYPEKLKSAIGEISHEFTVAIGLALRSLQQQ
ncbi:MAG: Type IV pilus assembly protein PilM [Candidatus Azambacteria bacterium GW2011_GWE1_42_9]|nr:MAG: Type IV pilus assembly protein PilM [Candidatus Azambacteria bacterium GW2011_GWF1_41_10]KKS49331.1 MAG: Type IV pilus assembly protein PilM [Candidatus Azambacteria bacterium GW2011_GWF2_42_22]KKS79822.1 MAG: Type IV pilus assembly protein PilM [Candidatus Azambacteria bacterium GW2011_GWE1_42_9]KKT03442.1 MAG: Type IV pilus assembly protein PilM [Candidatus Azambacteria bacterium GW2011_GWD1_43_18]KKT12470.1 MAG: Type IV pilus assembly protein PilM [Candidatus Azambacteria bacterium G